MNNQNGILAKVALISYAEIHMEVFVTTRRISYSGSKFIPED